MAVTRPEPATIAPPWSWPMGGGAFFGTPEPADEPLPASKPEEDDHG